MSEQDAFVFSRPGEEAVNLDGVIIEMSWC